MSCKLPAHGRVDCDKCFKGQNVKFDQSIQRVGDWRIKNNPLAWGGREPEIMVLGFSKGQTQSGAMDKVPHEEIAYKGGRSSLAKILARVGLLHAKDTADIISQLNREIANPSSRFHFGSFIRCGVEQLSQSKTGEPVWIGSGADMLGRFMKDGFGRSVVENCASNFLAELPSSVKLIVMLGMGSKNSYTKACFDAYKLARPGSGFGSMMWLIPMAS